MPEASEGDSSARGLCMSRRFLIEWSELDHKFNIFCDTGERVGSDPDAFCAEIKVGLMGFPPSSIVPPNSWEADEIRRKSTTY